jgi:hypothetical protein
MKSGRGLLLSLLLLPGLSHATAELDRQFALETVGYLRAWDNVDGIFADYVANAYKEYFAKQTRFTLQDLSKGDQLLTSSKLPYNKVIEDPEILGQLARAMRSESVIRTKIYKEGPRYRFTLDWLHSPKMDLMASETFHLDEPRGGKILAMGELKSAIERAVDTMVRKVPFHANVTGRDGSSVTVNVGMNANLGPGDTLVVATLEEVKKHPLLRAIVDWRVAPTGRLEVESVDEGIAFCRVVEEESGRVIARYQKVTQIIPKPAPPPQPLLEGEPKETSDTPPSLGFAAPGLWIGSVSRNFSYSGGGRTGGGMLIGGKVEGQLWFTSEWFLDVGLGLGTSGYDQDNLATGLPTGIPGGTVTAFAIRFSGGYNFYRSGGVYGQRAWVRAGLSSLGYSLALNTTEYQSPTTFGGPFLGLGADLPVRGRYGATLSLDFGILSSASETGLGMGASQAATSFSIYAGGYYRITPRMTARVGFDLMAQSADFVDQTLGPVNLTQKVVSFAPSIQFYF